MNYYSNDINKRKRLIRQYNSEISISQITLFFLTLVILFWDLLYFRVNSIAPIVALVLIFFIYWGLKQKVAIKIPRYQLVLFLYCIFQGTINIILKNDTLPLLLRQLVNIAVCFIVFSVVTYEINIEQIIRAYWHACVIMSLFALCEIVLALLHFTNIPPFFTFSKPLSGIRFIFLASLCNEPSFLGYFLAPITSLIILRKICPERIGEDDPFRFIKGWRAFLTVFISIMTFSLTTYVGIVVCLLIGWLSKGLSFKKILIPIGIITFSAMAYSVVPDIRMRVNDTLSLFCDSSAVSNTVTQNISSWTYYSNFTAAVKGFSSTLGFGNGLGSYELVYDKFSLGGWNGSSSLLNREDANSMFLRIIAELGIIGVVLVVGFFVKFFPKKNNRYYLLSCSILTLYIMLMIRQGNYTHGGVILFLVLYARIPKEGRKNPISMPVYSK